MNFATFIINSPNHFQGHMVHCPMNFDFELFDLYNLTIKHSNQKCLIGSFNEKKQKRPRNNSLGEKNSPPKRQRLESELSQGDIEDGSSGKEKEAPIEKGETTDDEPGQCFYIDDPAAKADCENAL